ncbi:M48 family metalloprotease [Streptomyces sp. NPDC057651]|uniref:M48 family metalloprotease n=1 Tax=unclassified Streptomyces TaxID=2593676 RepID=UPI00367C7FAF
MNTAVPQPSIDERALGPGTGARFAVLVVLMLVATGAMALTIVSTLHAADGTDCLLAAGMDPNRAGTTAETLRLVAQWIPFWACMDQSVPIPPWWQIALAPGLLAVTAALIFLLLPVWKVRRHRLVDLHTVDPDGTVLRLVEEAAAASGLAGVPRVVVDRATPTAGAVVFGRTRRPVVSLHGGLIACRSTKPGHLRTVLLHEFAHISNRDVTVTYATVALWRAFATLVLLPYQVWAAFQVAGFGASAWLELSPYQIRTLVLPLVLAALVYLARSDVLRVREIHADLTAARSCADVHRAVAATSAPRGLRGAANSLKALWSTHPAAQVRRSALTDPAPVFGLHALPALLTGASAVLIHSHLLGYLGEYRRLSPWISQGAALLPAVLVCGVIGTALWRSVAYAVVTGRPAPTGVRTGLWLGAGLGAGALVAGFGSGVSQWWIGGLAGLLLVVASGVAFTVWLTLCARLWAGTWRGRSLRPALVLCLAAALVVSTVWFAWLTPQGLYGVFWQMVTPGARQLIQQASGTGVGQSTVSAVAAVLPALLGSMRWPLFTAAAAAAWIVPALALALGPPGGHAPRWVVRARLVSTDWPCGREAPPALRRALAPGLLGGAVSWLAVAGALAYLHTGRGWQAGAVGNGGLRLEVWVFLASAGAVAVAALAAIGGRHPLVPLVAAQTAAAVGLAGTGLLTSVDGCIAPLSVRTSTCGWHPVWQAFSAFDVFAFVNAVLMFAFLAAAAAVLLQQVARKARRSNGAGDGQPSAARPAARWSAVALPAALVLVLAVAEPMALATYQAAVPDYAAGQRNFQHLLADPPTATAATRAKQVRAWYRHGGKYLLTNAVRSTDQLHALNISPDDDPVARAAVLARIRTLCTDIASLGSWEDGNYFRVPDPQAQSDWHEFGTGARDGSRKCLAAVDQRPFDDNAFLGLATARYDLDVAGSYAASTDRAVTKILAEAGYRIR